MTGLIETIFRKKPPTPLYHYTSHQGLYGIIKRRCFWLTQVGFLNDSSEIHHAIGLMKSKIIETLSTETSPDKRTFLEHLLEILNSLNVTNFNVFVFSFSSNGNLLSQWRGYCHEGGYSIGFDYLDLEKLLTAGSPYEIPCEVELGECLYKEEQHHNIISEILAKVLLKYQENINIVKDVYVDVVGDHFLLPLLKLAPFMKNHHFEEEHEWRLVVTINHKDKIQFREGSKCILPYYELPLLKGTDALTIKEIIIGPNLDQQRVKFGLERFLECEKVICEKISWSGIPFRG